MTNEDAISFHVKAIKVNPILQRLLFFNIFRRFYYKINFSTLRIEKTAKLKIDGSFSWADNCNIECGVMIEVPPEAKLKMGSNVYILRNSLISPLSSITIMDNVSLQTDNTILGNVLIDQDCIFAPRVFISSGSHNFELSKFLPIKIQDRFENTEYVSNEIHADCWLGVNVFVAPGIIIGKGCIIGANSVVTKSIYPYSIVGGVPARQIRKRLDFEPKSQFNSLLIEDYIYVYSGYHFNDCKLSFKKKFSIAMKLNVGDKLIIEFTANSLVKNISINDTTFDVCENKIEFELESKHLLQCFNFSLLKFRVLEDFESLKIFKK